MAGLGVELLSLLKFWIQGMCEFGGAEQSSLSQLLQEVADHESGGGFFGSLENMKREVERM